MVTRAPHLYHPSAASRSAPSSAPPRARGGARGCRSHSRSRSRAHGPALYEYRPLVRPFVEERAAQLRCPDVALIALDELRREPAAAIFARAHAGREPAEDDALFRTVLLDLLIRVAEACGGFDWDDASFDRAYDELELSLFGERRAYSAIAPLVGLDAGLQRVLSEGIRVRPVADGELARHWPEAKGLLPPGFGREPDRYCVLEYRVGLEPARTPPTPPRRSPTSSRRSGSRPRRPLAAGPVLFETLDGRPYGIRPVLPIAATQPPGEPTKLDEFRAPLAAELLVRLGLVDPDTNLAEALDRWELSLFQHEPFRSEQLRAALEAALGTTWPLRASILLETRAGGPREAASRPDAPRGRRAAPEAGGPAVRRALVEVLRQASGTSSSRGSTASCSACLRATGSRRVVADPRRSRTYTRRIGELILLTGASGYVGGRLLRALEERGERVRCLSRRPEVLEARVGPATEVVDGDVLDPRTIRAALDGVHTVYYLVHSMSSNRQFDEADREAAHAFVAAAQDAGIRKIVYLGGLGHGNGLSGHLRSRQEVGEILRGSGVPTIELAPRS